VVLAWWFVGTGGALARQGAAANTCADGEQSDERWIDEGEREREE
jgi:hypothetical protein